MDITTMRAKMERCKNTGIFYHKGRRVATCNPASLPLERRALLEAEEILQKCGCGALFSVYQSLAERYKSLIVLLPVSQTTDPTIARFLEFLELAKIIIVDDSKTKIYLLTWVYGIRAKQAKLDITEMFNADAEKTIRDIREMLTYSIHLCQVAQAEMKTEQNAEHFREILAGWERLKQSLSHPHMADADIEAVKRSIPHGGADALSIEPERIYNFVTDAYTRQIANSNAAYNEYQNWKRELLMIMNNDDSAGGGGLTSTIGR
jgi:hypothetical protein